MKFILNYKKINLFLLLIIIGFYNFFFYNNYAPITEGWFSTYAELIKRNHFPYKDFYFFLTPLYLLIIESFQNLFGNSLYSLRIFGIFVIVLMSLFLYLILNRKYSSFPSFVASIVGIIYYQSGVAHLTYDFTQFLSLFIIIHIYLMLLYSDYKKDNNLVKSSKYQIYLFLSGIFVSLAFLIKQSNGGIILFFSYFIVLFVSNDRDSRIRLIDLSLYLLSTILPIFLIMIWLFNHSALSDAFNQIFYMSISAKGGLKSIFFGWLHFFNIDFFKQFLVAVLIFGPILSIKFLDSYLIDKLKIINFSNTIYKTLLFFFSTIFVIILSYFLLNDFSLGYLYNYLSFMTYFINVITLGLLGIFFLIFFIFRNKKRLSTKIFCFDTLIAGLAAISLFISNGTSGGVGEISSFFVLSYLLAIALDIKDKFSIIHFYFIFICLLLILFFASTKFFQPYSWWYISSGLDISKNIYTTNIPVYSSMKLSLQQKNIYESIINAVNKYSDSSDDIFVFPNISGLYFITNRYPQSKVIVPWFDFLPDNFAINESIRIMNSPPKVIINLDLPEEAWIAHEQLFRNGNPLGQRSIRKVISDLIKHENLYFNEFSIEISPSCFLDVWIKND